MMLRKCGYCIVRPSANELAICDGKGLCCLLYLCCTDSSESDRGGEQSKLDELMHFSMIWFLAMTRSEGGFKINPAVALNDVLRVGVGVACQDMYIDTIECISRTLPD